MNTGGHCCNVNLSQSDQVRHFADQVTCAVGMQIKIDAALPPVIFDVSSVSPPLRGYRSNALSPPARTLQHQPWWVGDGFQGPCFHQGRQTDASPPLQYWSPVG